MFGQIMVGMMYVHLISMILFPLAGLLVHIIRIGAKITDTDTTLYLL